MHTLLYDMQVAGKYLTYLVILTYCRTVNRRSTDDKIRRETVDQLFNVPVFDLFDLCSHFCNNLKDVFAVYK